MQRIYNLLVNKQKFFLFSFIKALSMLLTLITNIIIIQRLDVIAYGNYSLSMVLLGTALTFGFFWSSSSIMYFGSKEMATKNTMQKSFWSRLIIMAVSWLLLTIMVVLFKDAINHYIGLDIAFILYVWLLMAVIEDFVCRYYLALKQQLLANIIAFTSKFIFLLLVIFTDFDVKQLLLLDMVSHLSILLFLFRVKKEDIGDFVYDSRIFKEILSFSLWQIFSFSLIYMLGFVDNLVIKEYLSTYELAMYNIAYRLFNNVIGFSSVILSFFASIVVASMAKGDKKSIHDFYYRQRLIIGGLSIIGHLVLIITSFWFIPLLFTDAYTDSVLIFNILMVGSMFRYLGIFYNIYLNATGRYKQLQYLNLSVIIINLIMNILLVGQYGLIGVTVSTSLSLAILFVLSFIYTEGKIKRNI